MPDGELRLVPVEAPRVLELPPGLLVDPPGVVTARPTAEDGLSVWGADLQLHLEKPGGVAVLLQRLLLVHEEQAHDPEAGPLPRKAPDADLGDPPRTGRQA